MAEGWFDINHSLLNSTLCSQRFSFSDDSECRLYPLCKEWSQVFSLHPCYWEFILLMLLAYRIIFLKSWRLSKSDWMLLARRTEAGLMGSPCDRHPPASPSATQKVWWTIRGSTYMTTVNIFSIYQSLPIRSDQNVPDAKKHETFQSAESYVQILPWQNRRKLHKSLL